MHPLHRKKLGIANDHRIVQTDVKVQISDTHVTSMYWYDEVDEEGAFVRSHVLSETNFAQKGKQTEFAKVADDGHDVGKDHPDDLSVASLRAHIRDRT